MELVEDNWKEVVKEQFTELKKQIEDIRLIYSKNDRKKTINKDIKCKIIEDDKVPESNEQPEVDKPVIANELSENGESSDSDEDSIGNITTKSNGSKSDVFINLRQEIEKLEKYFFNQDQNTIINENIFDLYGHLLMRTFDKMKMYLTDHDIYTKKFSKKVKNVENVLIKRQKQFQRLLSTSVLENYDTDVLDYETTLQHRINEFKLSQTKDKSFAELKVNCLNIFGSYIRQCVNFHSTLYVNGICGDFDEFVKYFFEQKTDVNEKERKLIEQSFAHFDIPLVNPQIVCHKKLHYKQNKFENFLPSQLIDESTKNEEEIDVGFTDLIKSIRNDRWTVLLGSAGSGKTTFARWLINQYARALFVEEKNIIVDDIDMGPVRIPILIRIGEFAQWLENHSTSSLFDYIGHHTWFGQNYINDGFENLKDVVKYGHALIILDGLDEVATTELHNRVIALVRVFIQSHCMSHEFISPFDNTFIAKEEVEFNFRCEGLFGGNLILITSRILNYTLHPLGGELITHYTIQPMSVEYLRSFVENWCLHVQDEIILLFKRHIANFKENKIKCQSNLKAKNLIAKIEANEGLRSLASNPSVLSIICTLFVRHGVDTFEKTRVQLYKKVVELMLQRWQYHQLNIPKDALILIFSNMAFYIHFRSGSGLIDEFDLNHLCCLSLQQWYEKNSNGMPYVSSTIRQQTQQFMQLLSEDAGIVAARTLAVYGFLHLSFQEYFVCYALVNINNSCVKKTTKELVIHFLSLFPNPRLREPLNLVMGWFSSNWTSENYDDFCIELQSKTNLANKYLPLGSLWFVSALNDLACLPSLPIVYDILNALLDAYCYENKSTEMFQFELRAALDRLPVTLVNNWFHYVFSKEDLASTWKMIRIVYDEVDRSETLSKWITPVICEILWKQIGLFNEEVDIYVDRILMIISVINCDRLPTCPGSLREYLLTRSIPIGEIHSSVLTAIITLYRGLERNYSKTKRQTSVIFAARRMHSDSPLSSLFIEYMEDTITERTIKLKHLIDQCQKILVTPTSTNTTSQKVHSLVVLFCFYSINQSSNYEQYIGSEVWQQAIRHMKIVLLYLREFFVVSPISKFKNNLTDIFEHFRNDLKENILDFAQSVSHAYCRLLRTETSSLFPEFYMKSENRFPFAIKMPKQIELPNVTYWSEDKLVRLLPFICCVSPVSAPTLYIEEFEVEDLKFLKEGRHPFQLLQNKPITLLLAYIPVSVQSLYIQLLAQNQISSDDSSCLPFLHLLIEFLCVMLGMQRYSIRFWGLFTVLLPTITQNRMENFVLPSIGQSTLERDCKQFFKAYEDNCFHSFASNMRIGGHTEKKCAEESAIIEEQDRIVRAQTDLQLYAAACCFARLTKSLHGFDEWQVLWETKFTQLWTTVQAIKQPVWRLDAMITICWILFSKSKDNEINNQLKDRFLSLMTWLQELESKIPLLTYVALFVRCMNFIREDFPVKRCLLHNILGRLKTVTTIEQQAICEALLSFPSFQPDINQHVRQLQYLENIVKLNQIFGHKSTTFSKYLSAKFFSTSDITGTRSVLLVSMQLSEINLYVKFLNDSVMKEVHHHHPTNNPISPSVDQTCLETLKSEPIESLNFQAASVISTLLCSHFAGMENVEIIRIEQALADKKSIDESAALFVSEWLCYRHDKRLCSFAYQGALLLGLSNMWTPTIIEICCQLLSNDYDHFRFTAIQLIEDKKWHSEKQSNHIIINYIDHWNKKKSKWCSEISDLFHTLDIQTIDEIEQILQLERNRFESTMKNTSDIPENIDDDYYEVSFFRLIENLSSEVKEYIIILLKSLLTCLSNSSDLLFLCWLFEHMPCECIDNENFIDFLIGILSDSYPNKLKILTVKKLYFFRENKQVENVLWKIVIDNEHENSDELVAICIWSLFIHRENDQFIQKKLKKLDHLRKHTRSPLIRQAAVSAMYSQIITEPEKYHVIDIYHSYITNAGFNRRLTLQHEGYDRACDWIIKHASILLPQFIDDMYKSFDSTSIYYVPEYVQLAKQVFTEIPNEFRVAVRQSSIGEKAFRKGLYKMSQRESVSEQKDYLYVYACFEQVSPDYVSMFFKAEFWDPSNSDQFEPLRIISERQTVELIINTLQSSLSLRQRCAAAKLLVYLTVIDEVSVTEVQNLLTAAIDDVRSQQIVASQDSLIKADQKLRSLLIRLMVKEPKSMKSGETINVINETSYIPIPAAVFQTTK